MDNNKPIAAGKSSIELVDSDKVFDAIAPQPGQRFLDLACGFGKYSLEIAERVGPDGKVYALDLWAEGLEQLREEAAAKGLEQIEAMLVDMTGKLPFPDGSLNACLIATTLHDLSKDQQRSVLNEVARILEDGGELNIIEFRKIDFGPGPPVEIRMTEEDVDTLVTSHGFEKIGRAEVGDYHYLTRYRKMA
ncbi:MAG: class I SAM-dependent methyltransferase [Desulfuromonadales bacterium]